jgi:hypothetical protein
MENFKKGVLSFLEDNMFTLLFIFLYICTYILGKNDLFEFYNFLSYKFYNFALEIFKLCFYIKITEDIFAVIFGVVKYNNDNLKKMLILLLSIILHYSFMISTIKFIEINLVNFYKLDIKDFKIGLAMFTATILILQILYFIVAIKVKDFYKLICKVIYKIKYKVIYKIKKKEGKE